MEPDLKPALSVAWILLACGCGGGGGGGGGDSSTAPVGSLTVPCENGRAGEYSCSGVSLRSRVSLATMRGSGGNDIWGWVDTQTNQEYALVGMTNGTAFVNVSDPENPRFLGLLPTQT